jgi:calcineurin-like phosphoesterase family protein
VRTLFSSLILVIATVVVAAAVVAQEPAPPVSVTPIEPPAAPFPSEAASAGVTRFSFLAYGDSRGANEAGVPGDGQVVHVEHTRLMDFALAKIEALATTPFPARFVLHSGDAVLRGANAAMWNVSFSPIIERLSRRGRIPFFFAAGNHDVSGMPVGDPARGLGLHNTLTAMSKLMPPDGSPRRLAGYPTYAVGYGNLFAITIDSNVASDPVQLAWVTEQLDRLDRNRFRHIVVFFHHPVFSSGPHGGPAHLEPATIAIRDLYMPLFRRHRVGLLITGHDHLFDHWVERYSDKSGRRFRMDQVITGGGGAPVYVYGGEPDLQPYLTSSASAADRVAVEHLAKPGRTPADNPHHFIVITVDGDRLSLEAVGSGAKFEPYNGRSRVDLFDRPS